MAKKKAKIYALKNKNNVVYIGKSTQVNKGSGTFTKSTVNILNDKLNKVIRNNDNATIEVLEEVSVKNWFDPKLNKIIEHHKRGANLHNAKHFLEGRRGYWSGTGGFWEGKTRDKNTLAKLAASKHKILLQYSKNGDLLYVWDSIKDVAINIFEDYQLINGSANSKVYGLLSNKYLKNRFAHDSYWIRFEEFTSTLPPIKIYTDKIFQYQSKEQKEKLANRPKRLKFSKKFNKKVYLLDKDNKKIKLYPSTLDAAKDLNIHPSSISKCCRYLVDSVYDGKYKFMFKKVSDREKYYPNLERRLKLENEKLERKLNAEARKRERRLELENEKLEMLGLNDLKINPVSREFNKDGKYIPKYRRPVICTHSDPSKESRTYDTLTLAANYFKIKGKHILYFIENEVEFKKYTFKYND